MTISAYDEINLEVVSVQPSKARGDGSFTPFRRDGKTYYVTKKNKEGVEPLIGPVKDDAFALLNIHLHCAEEALNQEGRKITKMVISGAKLFFEITQGRERSKMVEIHDLNEVGKQQDQQADMLELAVQRAMAPPIMPGLVGGLQAPKLAYESVQNVYSAIKAGNKGLAAKEMLDAVHHTGNALELSSKLINWTRMVLVAAGIAAVTVPHAFVVIALVGAIIGLVVCASALLGQSKNFYKQDKFIQSAHMQLARYLVNNPLNVESTEIDDRTFIKNLWQCLAQIRKSVTEQEEPILSGLLETLEPVINYPARTSAAEVKIIRKNVYTHASLLLATSFAAQYQGRDGELRLIEVLGGTWGCEVPDRLAHQIKALADAMTKEAIDPNAVNGCVDTIVKTFGLIDKQAKGVATVYKQAMLSSCLNVACFVTGFIPGLAMMIAGGATFLMELAVSRIRDKCADELDHNAKNTLSQILTDSWAEKDKKLEEQKAFQRQEDEETRFKDQPFVCKKGVQSELYTFIQRARSPDALEALIEQVVMHGDEGARLVCELGKKMKEQRHRELLVKLHAAWDKRKESRRTALDKQAKWRAKQDEQAASRHAKWGQLVSAAAAAAAV